MRVGAAEYDVELIVFDKDGCLVDLESAWAPRAASWIESIRDRSGLEVARATAAAIEFDAESERIVPGGILAAGTMAALRGAMFSVLGKYEWTADEVDALLVRGPSPSVTPIGDVAGAIARLVEAGVKIAVLTSDDRATTEHELRVLGIASEVSMVVCGNDGFPAKPDPAGYLYICGEMQIYMWRNADRSRSDGDGGRFAYGYRGRTPRRSCGDGRCCRPQRLCGSPRKGRRQRRIGGRDPPRVIRHAIQNRDGGEVQ